MDSIVIPDPINELAKKKFNIDYVFPFQRLVISNILRASGVHGFDIDPEYEDQLSPQQIVLLPTGAGKSLCFMLPSFILDGITIVIFPLLSLLSDQLRRTEECGLEAVILKGGQSHSERIEIFQQCRKGQIKMILTNPETLKNSSILSALKDLPITHVVIDETHCVSEWGDSFRPSYLELNAIIEEISPNLITAFTATASEHILKRIQEVLFPKCTPNIVYGNPDRPNIHYIVKETLSPTRTLIELVESSEKPLIVFSSSRTATELNAKTLRREIKSDQIFFYHAGLEKEEKDCVENWFFSSNDGILCATCAYGMGIDKKNIRTVIHTEPPSTVESYLQESGRAGRDREQSYALLIYSPQIQNRLLKLPSGLVRQRFQDMVSYSLNNKTCRRELLLSMLNSKPEICNGCDYCDESEPKPKSTEKVYEIIKKNKRRFSKRDFIYFLKGYRTESLLNKQFVYIEGHGILDKWSTDHIEELLSNMISTGVVRLPIRGFRKHRLTV